MDALMLMFAAGLMMGCMFSTKDETLKETMATVGASFIGLTLVGLMFLLCSAFGLLFGMLAWVGAVIGAFCFGGAVWMAWGVLEELKVLWRQRRA